MSNDGIGFMDHNWPFNTITNRDSHSLHVGQRNRCNILTVLSQTFLTVFERFTESTWSKDDVRIQYAKMDYTPETSSMFVLAADQLPITVAMVGERWARTVTSPEIGEIEMLVVDVVKEYPNMTDGWFRDQTHDSNPPHGA